jgi:hypothetical protein
LRWTGALPPSLVSRLDRVSGAGVHEVLVAAEGRA